MVFEDAILDRIALLLLGLALETTAKTLLVRQDKVRVVQGKMTNVKTHDLVSPLQRCNIEVSADEIGHLNVLRDYVEWFGRYPVPLAAVDAARSLPGAWNANRLPNPEGTWNVSRPVLARALSMRDEMFRVPLSSEDL